MLVLSMSDIAFTCLIVRRLIWVPVAKREKADPLYTQTCWLLPKPGPSDATGPILLSWFLYLPVGQSTLAPGSPGLDR